MNKENDKWLENKYKIFHQLDDDDDDDDDISIFDVKKSSKIKQRLKDNNKSIEEKEEDKEDGIEIMKENKKRKRNFEIINCLNLIKKLKENLNKYKHHLNDIVFENKEIEEFTSISFLNSKQELNEENEINLFSEQIEMNENKMIEEEEEEDLNECGICLLELYDGTPIYSLESCNHCFHLNCISNCINSRNIKNRCVKCFKSIKNDEINLIKKSVSFHTRNSRLLKREQK